MRFRPSATPDVALAAGGAFIATFLVASPAWALPTPDALLGAAQLLPVLVGAIAGVLGTVSVAVWRMIKRRKDPLRFLMRIVIGLTIALLVTGGYAAYLVAGSANEKLRANTAAYLRGDSTINQFAQIEHPKIVAKISAFGSEISFEELDRRIREDPAFHPLMLTGTRFRSRMLYDAGNLAFGPPGQEVPFQFTYNVKADILKIPAEERAQRDLILEGSSIRFILWPPDEELPGLLGSFKSVRYTKLLGGTQRDPVEHMYSRGPDGRLKRVDRAASSKLDFPVMDESRVFLDALAVRFPNWMELLSAAEVAPYINQDENPDTIIVVPTVGQMTQVKTVAYLLCHQLPGRFKPGTFDPDHPETAGKITSAYMKDKSVFSRMGVYIIDYSSEDLEREIHSLVDVVRGKQFMVVALSRTEWLTPGLDFAYHVYLDSKTTGAPFRYVGGTLVAAEAGADYIIRQAAENQSLIARGRRATARLLEWLKPQLGSIGAGIIALAFAIWLLTLPVALFGGGASIWRRVRDRRARTNGFLSGINSLASRPFFRISRRWEVAETVVAIALLFPGFLFLAAKGSPAHGAALAWIPDLGKPDLVMSLVITALIWARVAMLRAIGAEPSGATKIIGEATMFIGFAVLCILWVPAVIALYAGVLAALRLLVAVALVTWARRAMSRIIDARAAKPPAAVAGKRAYYERFEDITRVEACGGKAKNLAVLARLKSELFRVPAGLVLYLDELPPTAADFDEKVKSSVRACLPGASKFSVRSTSSTEDSEVTSEAGKYLSLLNVELDGIPAAVRRVYDSYAVKGSSGVGVIVQVMANARIAGVAFSTAPDNPAVGAVEYVEGLGEGLVSGEKTPGAVWFSRARGEIVYFDRQVPPEAERIFLAAMLLESVFGAPQDIEWAVADGTLFLLQARPITKYTHDEAVATEQRRLLATDSTPQWALTDISEIVDNPSRFTFSLLERVYSDKGSLGRALQATGLSTAGFKSDAIFGRLYTRSDLASSPITLLLGGLKARRARRALASGAEGFRAKVAAEYRADRIVEYGSSANSLTDEQLAAKAIEVVESFEREVYPIAFEATLRAGILGNNSALAKPVRTVASDFYQALATLSHSKDARAFAREWGHRSASDYDLASPSFGEDHASADAFAATFAGYVDSTPSTQEPLNPYQVYVQLKEHTKDYSVRYLRQARPLLVELARRRNLAVDALFSLSLDELRRVPKLGAAELEALVAHARHAAEAFKAIPLGEAIRLTDIESLGRRSAMTETEEEDAAGALSGQMLGSPKDFSGRAVPAGERDAAKLQGSVLVTGTLKPELVGLFDQISGVITRQGGVLSHAAIVAREKGVPVLRLDRGFDRLTPGTLVQVNKSGTVSFPADGS